MAKLKLKEENTERIECARSILEDKKLDALAFFSGESLNDLSSKNTYYLSGFFDSWPHAVVVTKKDAVVFTSEPDRAEKESKIRAVYAKKEKLHNFLRESRARKIGVDSNFTFRNWGALKSKLKGATFQDISREMLEIRSRKDTAEITKIKAASLVTREILKDLEDNAGIGDENALLKRVNALLAKHSAEAAFKPIVAGDNNSSNMHYFDCDKKYRELVMADIGARKELYNSDFTRTYILKKDKEMQNAEDALTRLVSELSDIVAPGKKCIEAHEYAKKFLEKEGYKKESFANFHSLGHGVGLDVHEYPVMTSRLPFKKMVFEENMVFTLEPALYFKGRFGIRTENTFLLEKNGLKIL